jgi:hypothetical protein
VRYALFCDPALPPAPPLWTASPTEAVLRLAALKRSLEEPPLVLDGPFAETKEQLLSGLA